MSSIVPGFHNSEIFEVLPNACLSLTARDVFDVLTARQEPGGLVKIRQQDIAERLGLTQSVVSRAIGQLRDKGITASGSARAPCSSTRSWPDTSRCPHGQPPQGPRHVRVAAELPHR